MIRFRTLRRDDMEVNDPDSIHKIQTYSGEYYDYLNPDVRSIQLIDIAHQLSNTCRFSGACKKYYSVAEHSVLVSRLCSNEAKRAGLLHDAAEAYLWDIPKPAKPLYGDVYAELTDICDDAIAERFGFCPSEFEHEDVDYGDRTMLNYEGNVLLPHWSADRPELPAGTLTWDLGLTPRKARALFMVNAYMLGIRSHHDISGL
jgi:hypothetical protein